MIKNSFETKKKENVNWCMSGSRSMLRKWSYLITNKAFVCENSNACKTSWLCYYDCQILNPNYFIFEILEYGNVAPWYSNVM